MDLVGAVDIGGTKIAVGMVDTAGQILVQDVFPTDAEKGLEDGLARILGALAACRKRVPDARMIGIGVGSTGPVDPFTGMLGPKSFLTSWEGSRLDERLVSRFGVSVAFENDADAAALGEAAWGAGMGASTCAYVTVSTGIGVGIIAEGRLYRGAGGFHPEIGHTVIDWNGGPLCYCGANGCWESLASGTAMAGWYHQRSTTAGLGPVVEVDAQEICRRAQAAEALALEAVEREGFYLGVGLANLITTFVPEVIVLGGGVMQSWPLFQERALAVIRQVCGLVPYEKTELRLASLGIRTGLAGAAQTWYHRYQPSSLKKS